MASPNFLAIFDLGPMYLPIIEVCFTVLNLF